jgi:hypothetical protein
MNKKGRFNEHEAGDYRAQTKIVPSRLELAKNK